MMRLKKVLVPVDFSKEAELAVEWAVKLAKEEQEATVCLLHILMPMPLVEGGFEIEKIIQIEWDKAKDSLEQWRRKIPPPLASTAIVGRGEPASEIANICAQEKIDLVVMTTHGRQGIKRAVHPNLSEKVVRTAPCPVLVLHLNQKTEAAVKIVA